MRSGRNGDAKRCSGVRAPERDSAEWVRCPAAPKVSRLCRANESESDSLILFTIFFCVFVRKCRKAPQHLIRRAFWNFQISIFRPGFNFHFFQFGRKIRERPFYRTWFLIFFPWILRQCPHLEKKLCLRQRLKMAFWANLNSFLPVEFKYLKYLNT